MGSFMYYLYERMKVEQQPAERSSRYFTRIFTVAVFVPFL